MPFLNQQSARQVRRSTKKNRKKRPTQMGDWLVNLLLLALSVLVISFIWSFWNRNTTNAEIQRSLASLPQETVVKPETLSAGKPYLSMKVEILNGNGVTGVAAQYKDLIRAKGFDVLQTDNADRFDYNETIILVRSANADAGYKLAEELGIDKSLVKLAPDASLRLDATLILGKDYASIPAYQKSQM